MPALTPGVRAAVLGAWISAAKVVLFTVGSASFLTGRPAAELAWVYLGLAALAAGSAVAMAPRLERLPPARSLVRLLLASIAATLALALGLAGDVPGSSCALLILAHLYNIASEIVFWLVVAAWLPPPELRRATVWICLAAALGGFAGGLAVERLLVLGPAAALTVGTLAAALGALIALRTGDRAIRPAVDERSVDADTATPAPEIRWREVLANPLGPPLGAAAFLLTLVWSMTEFMCLARYQELYSPAELGPQLARIFAVLQLVEFACILLLSGPATRWVPPAWRSVLFPLGALATLQLLGLHATEPQGSTGPPLWPILVAHAYTEAASNALFDPVHASNVAAVPARLQARLRAFSDGICYPMGMAAGAVVLLAAQSDADSLELTLLLATTAAMLFVGVGIFTGTMIGPSLLNELGLTAEVGALPSRGELRAALRTLAPWARRSGLRDRLLARLRDGPASDDLRLRVERADRRALRAAFALARRCDPGGPTARLETLLDSRSPERRALVVEAVLSLPLRRLFLPFVPALRRRYLPG